VGVLVLWRGMRLLLLWGRRRTGGVNLVVEVIERGILMSGSYKSCGEECVGGC